MSGLHLMIPTEVIRAKRDGHRLGPAQIDAFVKGLVDRSWSEGQVAAMAMAIVLRGMTRDECTLLTRAMAASGQVMQWKGAKLQGPILDKHSTGGVGDKVSLVLAPMVAACGGVVPMISGRGLGHTGGTLDKLAALPGYTLTPSRAVLLRTLHEAGCAIVGANARIAPADRRLYAVRDVTATVESIPLITASILSKKLAAGLDALVMDVKVGNGAFCADMEAASTLARSLIDVATEAGLPTRALITDMNQVLGYSAGNALEVQEAIALLKGERRDPRLMEVTMALVAELLVAGGLYASTDAARAVAWRALDSGEAAERFARMVAALGGPKDVLHDAKLPAAPVVRMLTARRAGVLQRTDTRAIGLALIELGAGRRRTDDAVDPRVGISHVVSLGTRLAPGDAVMRIDAASDDDASKAEVTLQAALEISDEFVVNAPLWRSA